MFTLDLPHKLRHLRSQEREWYDLDQLVILTAELTKGHGYFSAVIKRADSQDSWVILRGLHRVQSKSLRSVSASEGFTFEILLEELFGTELRSLAGHRSLRMTFALSVGSGQATVSRALLFWLWAPALPFLRNRPKLSHKYIPTLTSFSNVREVFYRSEKYGKVKPAFARSFGRGRISTRLRPLWRGGLILWIQCQTFYATDWKLHDLDYGSQLL